MIDNIISSITSKQSLRTSSFMGGSDSSMKIRMSFLMTFLSRRRFTFLFLMHPIFLLYFQQNFIQMLLLYILWKVCKNPRIYQSLKRRQSCLWIHYQYLLQKITKTLVLYQRVKGLTRWYDSLTIFSLDYFRRKIFIKVFLCMLAPLQILLGRRPKETHNKTDLFLLIFPSKERVSKIQFGQQATKTPNIYWKVVFRSQNDFRSPKISLIDEHTSPKVYNLDAHLRMMLHENIFRLQITMNHPQFLQKSQRSQQLYGKRPYIMHIQWSKVIRLKQLVQIGCQYFRYDAYMLPKYDEILYSQQIFSILYILLLDLHEDVYLVQRQLHMFSSRTDYLHSHRLSGLMVECLYHLTKSTSTQTLQKFISIPHLLMLLPKIPTLQVVLSHAATYSHIVNSLLIYELNPLILREHRFKTLQDLLSRKAWQGPSEVLIVKQLRLFDKWHFFLYFLQVLRPILMNSCTFLLDLGLAACIFLRCGGLSSGGRTIKGLGGLVNAGMPQILSV